MKCSEQRKSKMNSKNMYKKVQWHFLTLMCNGCRCLNIPDLIIIVGSIPVYNIQKCVERRSR